MTYVLCGDGEMNEGSNWEGIMSAAQYKLSNLVVFVDNNKCMIDGRVEDVMNIEPIDKKFEAFNFNCVRVDGHSFPQMNTAIEAAIKNAKSGEKPTAIILDTFKGEGVDYMRDNYLWHYGALDEKKAADAFASLDKYYQERVATAEKEGK